MQWGEIPTHMRGLLTRLFNYAKFRIPEVLLLTMKNKLSKSDKEFNKQKRILLASLKRLRQLSPRASLWDLVKIIVSIHDPKFPIGRY